MPHQAHSPLFFNYRSHKPLTTVFWLMDRPWWYYVIAMCFFTIKHSPIVLFPMATNYTIEGLIATPRHYTFANPWFVGVILFMLLQNIPTTFAYYRMIIPCTRRLSYRLRAGMVRRLQQLSIGFHDNAQAGRLQSKFLRDVDNIEVMLWQGFEGITSATANMVMPLAITIFMNPVMLLVYLLTVPFAVALRMGFNKPITKRFHDLRIAQEAMSARASQMIEMIPVTRAHAVETEEYQAMGSHLDEVFNRGLRADYTNALFSACVWVSMQIPLAACLGMTSYLCYRGKLNPGGIVQYAMFFGQISGGVQMLLTLIPGFARGRESLRSIGEVLECPDMEENEGKDEVGPVTGWLVFENVSFTYPTGDAPAIDGFSLDITPGECVAFVGESGGGKSTLMNLAIGFHRPTTGRLLLDGVDMETLDLRTYRRHLAVVPQRTVLLAGTIRENILYGLEDVSEDKLREAIEAANVAEFVDVLPDGLESMIGERGARLSGGQQQRIAVARALIRDPRIIILDEATSALDVISEALVQEAIDRLVADRTTLIVAHRLSTVRKADRIVVMKNGRCVEIGPPQELLETGGEFSRLHDLQRMLL
jgi:ATP-binding cassette subfamily B protein